MKRVYDGELAGNLILILGLEMENTVFNLSKHLVVISKFLRYWNNIVIMVMRTKLVKMIQIFFNNEVITVKCSASQRLVKYSILFKITTYSFET